MSFKRQHFCFFCSGLAPIIFNELFKRAEGQNKRNNYSDKESTSLQQRKWKKGRFVWTSSCALTLAWIYQFLHTVQAHVPVPVRGGCVSGAGPRLSGCQCCCHLLSLKYCSCISPQLRSCYSPHVLIWQVWPPPPHTRTRTHTPFSLVKGEESLWGVPNNF